MTLKMQSHLTVKVSFIKTMSVGDNNKIGKVEYIDIQNVFFMPHHAGRCTNVIQSHYCRTTVPTIILGHTNVAIRMVKAQGCPGLVAKARKRWPMGQSC
jgi:hypothetical protein